MRKEHDVCTLGGCGRPHKARGYCQTHYMQFKRGAPVTPEIKTRVREKPPECTENGCAEPVKASGLCGMHYQRKLRHGHTKYIPRSRPPKPCGIQGCENHLYSNGLCHAHYIKQRKWLALGVSAQRYQEMVAEQNGLCAICQRPERITNGRSGRLRDLAIDHCHEANVVRGLLCSACNTAVGLFGDSPATLRRAAAYMERHGRTTDGAVVSAHAPRPRG